MLLQVLAVGAAACSSAALPGADAGGTGGAVGVGGTDGGAPGVGGGAGRADASIDAPPVMDGWQVLAPPLSRKLDMLFMIDNSQSMLPLQSKLIASFPSFMNVLKALPGGLPDVHVAVVSSDTGPAKFDLPDRHCAFRGDGGRFQSTPRGTCVVAPLPAGQTFLAASQNQQQRNYTGDITDAFTCIAALGDQGCGFEGQLKSVRWALDPHNLPAGNAGFLRDEAYLAVVLVTNEDDCSLPDDSDLADPTQTLMTDPLGPLWSWRCNEFGHLCIINGTLQSPPRATAMSNLQGCISNETATSKLTRVGDEVSFLRSLKQNPNQVLVAAISGPPTPYSYEMIQTGLDVAPHPNIVHSCTQNSGEFADPSVRIQQWVASFGVNGLSQSICASTLAPALQLVGNRIAGVFGPTCVSGPFPATSPGAQPACRVVDRSSQGANPTQVLLPNCTSNGQTPPCWSLVDDVAGCLDGKRLVLDRGTTTPPADLTTAFTCAPCAPGSTEIGCP